MKKRFIAALCIVLMLCTLVPMSAAADSSIDKVLCTTSTIPVAQANSKDIYAATSTAGCYIESYIWRRTSDGYIIYQLFGTENVEVEITLRALDGWHFSDAVAVYLNNSPANFYIGEGGKTLTTRIFLGKPDHDDLSHDGDVGGGQFLNACVAFEVITGKSCLENSFVPHYEFEGQDLSLSEEKITLLKNSAHQAVAGVYGEDFAK